MKPLQITDTHYHTVNQQTQHHVTEKALNSSQGSKHQLNATFAQPKGHSVKMHSLKLLSC